MSNAESAITEDTRVPLRLIQWLVGVMVAGIVTIGGVVLSFSNDVAVLKRDTSAMVQQLDKIASSVDGLADMRSEVSVQRVLLEQHERRISAIESKVK